jgi:alpha-N-arabinofuranosidase
MSKATATIDPAFVVGPVRRRTFGSFVEHLGRCVYGGIFEGTGTQVRIREGVLDLVKKLGVSTVRYPGGNFVSGYRWEDGTGPISERPRRLDLAWHTLEPNWVGIDEFMEWARRAGVEPMMAVNLGTRGVQEAIDLLEYSNIAGGTALSDQRRANGGEQPYGVKMWCLGNEMDGPWQTGHKTPAEYGRLAAETARAMRQIQPDLELVACGSSSSSMATFGEWERQVLTECYDLVDYVSAHAYYWEEDGDLDSFLASAVNMDHFIESVVATADAVKAAGQHTKNINISFDEWNVWYMDRAESNPPTGDDWPIAPTLLEDHYNVADAVVVGSLLISLLRHTDRVHAASLAQLVNVIAPIMVEKDGRIWKQTSFHPFAQASHLARGNVLNVVLNSPTYHTAKYGDVPVIDAVATSDSATGEVAIFAVNRSQTETIDFSITLRAPATSVEATSYNNPDHTWQASAADDSSVLPRPNESAKLHGDTITIALPPLSWNTLRIR